MKATRPFDVPDLSGPSSGMRYECVDCGSLSPQADTGLTSLSSKYGWRLHRTSLQNGETRLSWRCPHCWEEFRGRGEGRRPSWPPYSDSFRG